MYVPVSFCTKCDWKHLLLSPRGLFLSVMLSLTHAYTAACMPRTFAKICHVIICLSPHPPHKNLRLCNRCEIVGCILGQGQEGLCVCIYRGGVMNIKPKWHCQWLPSPWISSSSSCLLVPEVPPPPPPPLCWHKKEMRVGRGGGGGGGGRIKRGKGTERRCGKYLG